MSPWIRTWTLFVRPMKPGGQLKIILFPAAPILGLGNSDSNFPDFSGNSPVQKSIPIRARAGRKSRINSVITTESWINAKIQKPRKHPHHIPEREFVSKRTKSRCKGCIIQAHLPWRQSCVSLQSFIRVQGYPFKHKHEVCMKKCSKFCEFYHTTSSPKAVHLSFSLWKKYFISTNSHKLISHEHSAEFSFSFFQVPFFSSPSYIKTGGAHGL